MTVAQTKNETLGFKNPVSKCLENKIRVWRTPSLSQGATLYNEQYE